MTSKRNIRLFRRETCSFFLLKFTGMAQICSLKAREMSHPRKEDGEEPFVKCFQGARFPTDIISFRFNSCEDLRSTGPVIMVLGLCCMLLTDPVCFYSMYGNHTPHAPTTQYGTTCLLPQGFCSPLAQLTTFLNLGFEIKEENYIIFTEKY